MASYAVPRWAFLKNMSAPRTTRRTSYHHLPKTNRTIGGYQPHYLRPPFNHVKRGKLHDQPLGVGFAPLSLFKFDFCRFVVSIELALYAVAAKFRQGFHIYYVVGQAIVHTYPFQQKV